MGTIKRNFSNNVTPTGKFDSADLTGTIPATNVADASLSNITSVPASVGDLVQKVASDPSPASAGDVWYNTTSNALKSLLNLEAWSSGGSLITARAYLAGMGTQTAALAAGGSGFLNSTEEYNGSGWSNGGNLNTARNSASGTGTQTAGLAFGGTTGSPGSANVTGATEEYNGTSWSEQNDLNTATQQFTGAGTQTAGLGFGGYVSGNLANTEEYDGTSWTAANALNTSVRGHAGAGIQTAAVSFGGVSATFTNATEEYDGTSWTAVNSMNTARATAGVGTQNAALAFGGSTPPFSALTEKYDGTTWTTSPATLATARQNLRGAGTQLSALAMGGETTVNLANTEEYNSSTNVITAAAWASGATQPVARQDVASFGTSRSEGIMFAGGLISPGYSTSALTYDGTWTSNPSLNTGRGLTQGFGTIAAGNVAGGYNGGEVSATENWNGSTWTTTGSLNNARRNSTAFGTQTAGVVAGSSPAAPPAQGVEHFNGTSWTTATSLPAPTTATYSRGCGTQTAGLWIREASAFEYNGSAWTASNSLNTPRIAGSMGGIQTSALYGTGSQNASTEFYDGTSWRTDANVGIPATRSTSGPAGNSSSLVRASGENTPSGNYLTSVEDYNPETSATNVVTISSS